MGQELISPLRGFKNTFELCCVSERETEGSILPLNILTSDSG